MAAVRIPQLPCGTIVIRKELRGVTGKVLVLIKQAVHGGEQPRQIIHGHSILASQISLQVGHQQRCGDAFTGDIGHSHRQAGGTKLQEIMIIAAHGSSRKTTARVVQGFYGGELLGKSLLCTWGANSISWAALCSASMRSATVSPRRLLSSAIPAWAAIEAAGACPRRNPE